MTIHKTSTGNDRKLVKRRKCDGIYENPYAYQLSHFNDNLPETIKVRKANNKPIGPCPENGGLMLTLMPSLVMQPNFNQPGMDHLTAYEKADIIQTNHFYTLILELPLFRAKQGRQGEETFETLLR